MTRSIPWLLALSACAQPAVPEVDPGLAPPPIRFALAAVPTQVVAHDSTLWLQISGARPGRTVFVAVGTAAGAGPCPRFLGGGCFDILQPTLVGAVTTDAVGAASLSLPVPPATFLPGGPYVFQAVQPSPAGVALSAVAPVLVNDPPSVTCEATPSDPDRATPLTAVPTVSDPDGDPVTLIFRWQLQIGPLWVNLPGETHATLPSCDDRAVPPSDPAAVTNCEPGDALRVVCTALDGHTSSAPTPSPPVVVVP